jgi:restriction system-associated AAA family ATPase
MMPRKGGATIVRLEKTDQHPVTFKIIRNSNEELITDTKECLALLPTRVLGYSSGLNETISIPYFRTAAIYSQEVLKQARREKAQPGRELPDVPDSRTFFMDYEFNALILVSNYMLQPRSRLQLFRKYLRIDSLTSFDIRYRPKYQGNKPVQLTRELESYLGAIRSCASSIEHAGDKETRVFHFTDPKAAAPRLKAAFKTAGNFFRALYKLSLLNPLALSGKKRKFFLRDNARTGQLEKPPTISREDRIFSVENIRVNLTEPKRAIDYAGISDGEHQFMQIFGSVILFDEPGCIFLLDEPETHFNPQWRRLGIQWLAGFKSTMRQELMVSTHSPFVVSGCRGRNVLKFSREGDQCVASAVGFETFGASYDLLLARLFSMETMIAGEAIEEMRELVESSSIEKLRKGIPRFGESLEKRFIFERIAQLEKNKKKRKK